MSTKNLVAGIPARQKLAVGEEHELHAVFTFNPPAMDDKRAPLDIAVALDVSGSMGRDKMEAAKNSLLKLVEHLKPTDRLALVTFTSHVETVFAPTMMTPEAKTTAREAIRRLYSQNSTNLSGGLFKALDHLKESAPLDGGIRRCMIFTDGQANVGIQEPDQLATMALEYRSGIGISSFGYGRDHHEKLLEAISQDGDFYFIDTPDKILSAFGAELGGLISTFAQNVVLTLTAAEGVKIVEVMNDLTVREEGENVVVECDDLLAEQEYSVVVRLKLDERKNAHPRGVSLVKAQVSYLDVAQGKKATDEVSIKVQFVAKGKEDTKDEEAVVNAVAFQKAIQAQNQAIKMADAGDFTGARACLLSLSRDMQCVGTKQALALGEMSRGLADENFASAALYAAGGSSEARAIKKGMARRRMGVTRRKGNASMGELYGGTKAQADMALDFEGGDADADADAKGIDHESYAKQAEKDADTLSSSLSSSLSKSRTRSSW